jgi:hypothetical protein
MAQRAVEQLGDKLIRKRLWEHIAGFWLSALPSIESPGEPPEAPLSEVLAALGLKADLQKGTPLERDVKGLRQELLRESIFLLHKASHVLSCAQVMHVQGRRTWALSDGYHAALFASRAVLGLLGIGATDLDSRSVVFNVWPIREKEERARRRPQISNPPATVFFMSPSQRLDHSDIWSLFSRAIRVIALPLWLTPIVEGIKKPDRFRFSHQRNSIHYSSHAWPGGDLHVLHPPTSEEITALEVEEMLASEKTEQFSLALGLSTYLLGIGLIESIQSHLLDSERAVLASKITLGWHPMVEGLRVRMGASV